ncbi:hypothetical protein ABW19_dt0209516 [Dactylella cylindrospora]|nr:hypothetical protein ABW19_dt0209516 [Dactylella cylindrospora]
MASSNPDAVDALTNALAATNIHGADEEFRARLAAMPKVELNNLNLSGTEYTRTQKRLIDEERVRRRRARANQNATLNPTATAASSVPENPTSVEIPEPVTVVNEPINEPTLPNPTAGLSDTADAAQSGSNSRRKKVPPTEELKPWYIFKEYHYQVAQQVQGVTFHGGDEDGDDEFDKNLVGSFRCSKKGCKNSWSSGVVASTVRRYNKPGNKFGYNARVYNQRCLKCDSLGNMKLDIECYVDRVVRQLKIWKGESVPEIRYFGTNSNGEHEDEHCEGCKAGHCKWYRLRGLTLTSRTGRA